MIQTVQILGTVDRTSLAVLCGAILAPVITYIVAARQFSGKIRNSDADALWEESRSIRDWSTERIQEQNRVIERLEKRVDHLEAENQVLREEKEKLGEKISGLNDTITSLRGEIDNLTEELKHSRLHPTETEDHDGL